MSDKELDQLFQSRFDAFEAEPPASLWSSIESQLESKPGNRRAIPVFWMAAASVVVLLGAGLWLFKPEQKVYLEGNGLLAKVTPAPEAEIVTDIPAPTPEILVEQSSAIALVSKKKTGPALVAERVERAENVEPQVEEASMMIANAEPKVEEPKISEAAPVVAAEEVHPHSRRGEVHQTVLAMLPPEEAGKVESVQQRRRIKSVGDIVNFVVAKVDQREDKLIELSEDDEGTKISGINLGLFKIKSKKR